jgi:hypothetical protein
MAVNLSMLAGAGAQFFDNNGAVLSGGLVYTYAAGTTTPQATYTTSAGNVAHTNPIVLNSAGRVASGGEIWLTDAVSYKFVLETSAAVTIATYDNVTGNGSGIATGIYAAFAASSGSSFVGYTQGGTGATATTVQARLRQYVSVKDFGAVGNGVTDDTTAIQNAVNYAISNPVNLYFPSGTYLLSARITGSSANKICLIGAGRRLTNLLWTATATNGGGIDITFTDFLYPPTVQGMTLLTRANGVGTALKITGVDAPSITVLGPNVSDVEIIGEQNNLHCWDIGIHFSFCWYSCVTLITIKGLEELINPFTQSAGIKLTDCQVIFANKFSIIHVEDAILEENILVPRGEGFVFNDFELVGVTNGFQLTAGAVAPGTNIGPGHINSYKLGINLANHYQTCIHDILFYKTYNSVDNYIAIQMVDSNSNHIHDNEIHGSATATGDTSGIVVTGTTTSDYNNIHDNYFRDFYGTTKVGIVISTGAGFNNIHDNNCDSTVTTNVQVDSVADKTNYLNRNLPTSIQSLTPDVATPSVGNDLCGQWNSTPTVATTITNFTDAYVSQVITVFATNTNTTLQNNATMALANGVNYVMGAGQLVTLRKDATLWREVSRSV